MRLGRITGILVAVAAAGAAAFAVLAWHPAIAPVAAPPPASPNVIQAGETLAALGYCASCHTAEGGRPYAGGRPIKTPFGTIYATNITPDARTGLGGWSLDAFTRAMRQGIDREGRHLYPAFPYIHYTGLTDGDVAALYAFVMSRTPVEARTPENDLPFPFSVRALMAGWNLLFFREGRFTADPNRTRSGTEAPTSPRR